MSEQPEFVSHALMLAFCRVFAWRLILVDFSMHLCLSVDLCVHVILLLEDYSHRVCLHLSPPLWLNFNASLCPAAYWWDFSFFPLIRATPDWAIGLLEGHSS